MHVFFCFNFLFLILILVKIKFHMPEKCVVASLVVVEGEVWVGTTSGSLIIVNIQVF